MKIILSKLVHTFKERDSSFDIETTRWCSSAFEFCQGCNTGDLEQVDMISRKNSNQNHPLHNVC